MAQSTVSDKRGVEFRFHTFLSFLHPPRKDSLVLIEVFSALFDELSLTSNERKHASRALVRTLCKLATYRHEVDTYLRKELGKTKERDLFKFWQNQRTNYDMIVLVWRGIFCYVETQNAEHAETISGIKQSDIRYAYNALTKKDIAEIKASRLSWRKPPIGHRGVVKLLDEIKSSITYYTYKMKFVEYSDGSLVLSDIRNMLRLEALSLIIRYESERNRVHLKNTVLRGLKAAWSEMCSYYKRDKRDCMPSTKVLDANNQLSFTYESIREPLVVRANSDDSDGETENPSLLSKCLSIDKELETRSIVQLIEKKVPRFGKYLRLVVLDKSSAKFKKWLRENKKNKKTSEAYIKYARTFCGITPRDEQIARKLVSKELGIADIH